jgi:predicted RNA methylase
MPQGQRFRITGLRVFWLLLDIVSRVSEKLGNRRVTGLEQYYTPKHLAQSLTKVLFSFLDAPQNRQFLEPAGGTGSFIEALADLGAKSIISMDTHPKHSKVTRGDFLKFQSSISDLVTISNPPFGRNNALSIPFFNHAADVSTHIAFLVPRSWRKWSVQNRLDPRFHLVHDQDVNLIYEDQEGEPLAKANELRTCFQIWERRDALRPKTVVPDNGFLIKTSPDQADVAVRVFGYGCGQVLESFEPKPNTTLMFLSLQKPVTASLLRGLDFERFRNNTAYTQALSFQEINYLLNEKLLGDGLAKK